MLIVKHGTLFTCENCKGEDRNEHIKVIIGPRREEFTLCITCRKEFSKRLIK